MFSRRAVPTLFLTTIDHNFDHNERLFRLCMIVPKMEKARNIGTLSEIVYSHLVLLYR